MTWYGGVSGGGGSGAPYATEIMSGWVTDSNSDYHYFIRTFDETSNTYGSAVYTDAPGGSPTTPVGSIQPVTSSGGAAAATRDQYTEVIRLDGDLVAVAVPEIPVYPGHAVEQVLVPGNTYSLTGSRQYMWWRFLRETAQDAVLDVNSRSYVAGSGGIYVEQGDPEESEYTANLVHTIDFQAYAGCYVEIKVIREVP